MGNTYSHLSKEELERLAKKEFELYHSTKRLINRYTDEGSILQNWNEARETLE